MIDKVRQFLGSTWARMIAGYLLIVCVPVGVFGVLYLRSIDAQLHSELAAQKQRWSLSSANQFAMQMQAIERAHASLQVNDLFTSYIGIGDNAQRYVYEYNKYVKYYLSDIKGIDSHILEVFVYTSNPYLPRMYAEFAPLVFSDTRYRSGEWSLGMDSTGEERVFCYRRNLYDNRYASFLGVLEINVSVDILAGYFPAGDGSCLLVSRDGEVLVETGAGAPPPDSAEWAAVLANMDGLGAFAQLGSATINAVYLECLNAYCVMVEPEAPLIEAASAGRRQIMLAVGGLLMLFSLFYYWIIAGMMRRIVRLSRHIRTEDPLATIDYPPSGDEIGHLYATYNAKTQRIAELLKSLRREERLRQDAAYAALQARVQPHFLYGTLETIRMMAVQAGDQGVANLAFAFAKLMRYSLGAEDTVTLGQEVENARDYLAVKKTRLEERLAYEIDVPIALLGIDCPRFILQPVIENAVVHGIGKLLRNGCVRVRAEELDGFVYVLVEDDGIGMGREQLEAVRASLDEDHWAERPSAPGNGFALYSVHNRLRQFYGQECGLTIDSAPNEGARVLMRMRREGRYAERPAG